MTQQRNHRRRTAGRLVAVLAAAFLTTQCGGTADTEPGSEQASQGTAQAPPDTPSETGAADAGTEDQATDTATEDQATNTGTEDTAEGTETDDATESSAALPAPDAAGVRIGGGVVLQAPEGLDLLPVGAQEGAPLDTVVIDTCVGEAGINQEGDSVCNQTHVLTGLEENPGLDLLAWSNPEFWPCLAEGADPWTMGEVTLHPEPVETGTEQVGDLSAEWTRWEAVCGDGQSFYPEQWWFPEVGALVQNPGGGQVVADTAAGIARDEHATTVLAERVFVGSLEESGLEAETATPNEYGWERAGTQVELTFSEGTVCFTSGEGNYGEDITPTSCAELIEEFEEHRASAEQAGADDSDPLASAVYDEDGTLIALSPQFRS